MNNDFDRPSGDDNENRIRNGYEEAQTSAPADGGSSESEPENKSYRFRATMPAGGEHYYDYTKTQQNGNGADASGAGASSQATPYGAGISGGAAQTPMTAAPYYGQVSNVGDPNPGLSTASLVLGIIGLVLAIICCGGFVLSLGFGVAGLVCALKSRSPLTRQYSDSGKAGLILSIIAIILGSLLFLVWMFYIVIIAMTSFGTVA